ncbi:MAG: DUF4339 domain-containing protein [Planctomycetaceae bacterium]|nr:DUF4339 domain-containing protein [Planctomycetaceae bacterium]
MSNIKSKMDFSPTMDDGSDLEFAHDLSELDIDFDSGSGSRLRQESAPETPSIDDFELVSENTYASKHAKHHEGWYAQVMNQEIGPFPFAQLVQMVVDQEIGCNALLRHGRTGDWIRAGDIEGLFSEPEQQSAEAADDGDFELRMQDLDEVLEFKKGAGPVAFQAVGGEINRVSSTHPRPASSVAPTTPPVTEHSATPAGAKLAEAEPVAAQPAKKQSPEEKAAARKLEIAARLNAWLDDKVQTPESPADEQESPAIPAAAAAVIPAVPREPAGYGSPSGGYGGAQTVSSPPAFGKPSPQAAPTFKKVSRGGSNPLSGLGGLFGKISLPEASSFDPKLLIVLGVIALVFGLMYLPGLVSGVNDMAVYNRLNEIYTLVEQARAQDMGKFAALTPLVPEIKEIATKLEKDGAGAAKPAKQQLFWASRNCLAPLIEQPSKEPGPLDQRFKSHMTLAGRLLGDPTVPPPPPPSENSDDDND